MIKINFRFPKKWRFVKRNVELVGLVVLGLAILVFIIIGFDTVGRHLFYGGPGDPAEFKLRATDYYYVSGNANNIKPLPNAMDTENPAYENIPREVPLGTNSAGDLTGLFRIQGQIYE